MSRFAACFEDLPDPRGRNARHPLTSILFIAVAAIVCGAESCTDMADFGVAKKKWLKTIVPLPYGIPSHDTFSTVFRHLDPDAFDAAFRRLTASFAQGLEGVVAIDGKAVRGAYRRAAKATPLHFVNVWAAGPGLVIGQKLAPGRNEVQGALDALALLALEGSIVTADALHCRPDTARAILAAGGDYALALKANQPGLLAQALARIEDAGHVESIQIAAETAHDRTETRRASVVAAGDINFPGLQAIGCVETTSRHTNGHLTSHVRYFLLSTTMSPSALTLRSCARSLSTSCDRTPTRPPSAGKLKRRAGMTNSSLLLSLICDSPAARGDMPYEMLVTMAAEAPATSPFAPLAGRRCRQADEGRPQIGVKFL
ncbi:transposase IS4 family protein [Sinorhizobium meliloti Rm41]|nr:transposase IS4 family protein [Sinorhizobium meliloti Rm41]